MRGVTDRWSCIAAIRGEKAALLNPEMTRRLLAEGQASILQQVLTAQQLYAQASAKAARLTDTVLLFQALGRGWRNQLQPVG